MKKLFIFFVLVVFLSLNVRAENKTTKVNEYGEPTDYDAIADAISKPDAKVFAKSSTGSIKEKDIDENSKPIKKSNGELEKSKITPVKTSTKSSSGEGKIAKVKNFVKGETDVTAQDRDGQFKLGLEGPGYAYATDGVGSLFLIGAEGEYFFFERLSALLRIDLITKFDDASFYSFVPMARYYFDSEKHPRLAAYVQAGVGASVYDANGTSFACDIALPGVGMLWQWREKLSVGMDATLHIYAKSSALVGFTVAPMFRYTF